MWARRDGTDGGHSDESAKCHTGENSAVVGTPHPWTSIPIGSAAPAGGTMPNARSSPTGLAAPAGIGAGARVYARARGGTVTGPPGFVRRVLDCYGLARPAGERTLGDVSGRRLANRVNHQRNPHHCCHCCVFSHSTPPVRSKRQ